MGRKKKYETVEELQEARRRWRREYYNRNREACKQKRMDTYWRNKKLA